MPDVSIPAHILSFAWPVALLCLLFGFAIFRYFRRNRVPMSPQHRALHHLKKLELQEGVDREALYQFSLYVQQYLDGRRDEVFEEIQQALLAYKYHTEAPQIDEVLIQKMRDYIGGLS